MNANVNLAVFYDLPVHPRGNLSGLNGKSLHVPGIHAPCDP